MTTYTVVAHKAAYAIVTTEQPPHILSTGWREAADAEALAARLAYAGGACEECACPATHYYLSDEGIRYLCCTRHTYEIRRWERNPPLAAL